MTNIDPSVIQIFRIDFFSLEIACSAFNLSQNVKTCSCF
ncbi:hypothetical protein CPTD_00972 [Corynebacterium pseudotuberculosis]|nr:hypothetical protein CPTD_00972 [Corynebacterium pseudotuberculosis]